ncbi:MAG: SUMF1/EgtB/PvdO family nonheme iron enzyme [Bacteroidaceae bacterium]|nr:SUMF1/EgtB/PvdO family nonheme iron enzyme [Bacteroidaceae bacterium]
MKKLFSLLPAALFFAVLPLSLTSCGGSDDDDVVPPTPEATFSDKTITVGDVTFKMVAVEGGTFQMGVENYSDDEAPVHSVTLSNYYIAETEVTQALYKAIMGENPSEFKGDKLPVESLHWGDIQTFIAKLNALTGLTFRLPTEAEWEYAARGGNKSQGYKYSGSDNIAEVAWFIDNSNDRTNEVATKKPNELGLYDMSGNVMERCSDSYDPNYYASSPATNPQGPTTGNRRVVRGGCFWAIPTGCRMTLRYKQYPFDKENDTGFRLAITTLPSSEVSVEGYYDAKYSKEVLSVNGVTFKMQSVQGGTFYMGSDDADAEADAKPVHAVTLSDYYIGETEVTQALFKAVMGDEYPSFIKGDNLPVNKVTWDEMQVFIKKLNELTGRTFRLPTEAEWEYAARGGQKSRGYKFSGSDDINLVAWYNGGSSLQEVALLSGNELGLYDMTGNVLEFCSDWYSPTYYLSSPPVNPQGPPSGTERVGRGGDWNEMESRCTVTYRQRVITGGASVGWGCRLALSQL